MKLFSKRKDDDIIIPSDDTAAFTLMSSEKEKLPQAANVLTPEEILGTEAPKKPQMSDGQSALEALKRKISEASVPDSTPKAELKDKQEPEKARDPVTELKEMLSKQPSEPKPERSLFDKCMPYILDDDGNEAVNAEPLYKLQSVADILKSDSEKTLERLSKNYDISFDDLGHGLYGDKKNEKPKTAEKPQYNRKKSPERKTETVEKQIFEDTVPIKNRVKNIQSSIPSVISDIDVPEIKSEESKPTSADTTTITFTPVSDSNSTSHISVTTQTRPIDLTGELVRMPEAATETTNDRVTLEKNDFEEFVPVDEINGEKDIPRFVRELSIKKRRAFLQSVFTFLTVLILAVTELPFLSELLQGFTRAAMLACAGVALVAVLINCDMLLSFARLFRKNCGTDVFAASATLFTAVYAAVGIVQNEAVSDILLLLTVILFFRALGNFWNFSRLLSNLKIIANEGTKKAVRLISDKAVAFAMAKNAVEGDALIAVPQRADNIGDYIKYSTYGEPLGGKIPVITALTWILSAAVGFACAFYFDGLLFGLYAAAAVHCISALPVLFLAEKLPLYRAARRLNQKGAMLAGKTGAEHIEMANAAVFSAMDFFPSGTVVLHQMQVLSENNLQDTIVRAASLTESLGSPLTPIFKRIAGTGNITAFPDSDTVKYEEKMGISGWVDNRLLFIGNRTLMEAHGIEVPPVDVDKRILKQGFFPVYVADRDKACALLIIQYNVDSTVEKELRRLTGLGVTVLVNSCDPNLTEEMLCDYFGLYEDCVKVMSAAGCHMYRSTVTHEKTVSAPAAYRANPIALASIITCASRLRRSDILLSAAYIICAVLGIVIFTFASLGGSGTVMSQKALLLYGIIATAASYLIYLIERP